MDEHTFTSARPTAVQLLTVQAALRATDPTVAIVGPLALDRDAVVIQKATAWTAPQITATQTLLDTATDPTSQGAAQLAVDAWPLEFKALVLALIDQFNVLRAFHSLPPITPTQAIAAIRTKAGTL